jgi:ribosomal silencing factor RsfS
MEFTRLGLVAAEPRGGVAPVRDATRRADDAPPTEDEIERLIAIQAEQAQWGEEGRATTAGTLDLPYDDPGFADAILKMEVEGALDDLWQDAPRARIEDVEAIVNIMRELKVRDVVAINTSAKTSSFDYLVVGTCDSLRHISLVAWSVSEADRLQRPTKVKRRKSDDVWDVVTVGRIVVNLMVEGYRNEVNVERKWAVTKSMDPLDHANSPVSEGRLSRMHGLWTLTLNLQDLEDFEVDYCKDVLLRQL